MTRSMFAAIREPTSRTTDTAEAGTGEGSRPAWRAAEWRSSTYASFSWLARGVRTVSVEYALEYGTNVVEVHTDAIRPGERVLIVDDLLATGGTVSAAMELVEKLGGHIAGIAFLVELTFLKGREQLKGHDVFALIKY